MCRNQLMLVLNYNTTFKSSVGYTTIRTEIIPKGICIPYLGHYASSRFAST